MAKLLTGLKHDGKEFAAGDTVSKKDFTPEQWEALVEAGAIEVAPPKEEEGS